MLSIKVLGGGCPNCKKLEAETRAALDGPGIPYELTKVTDFAEIATYGVMNTPALVIDEKVVSSGKIPARGQILTWALEAQGNA
jgi:small redox-active disulfide protein 2